MFGSCAKFPLIEVLALWRLCNNIALPSCFVLIAHRNEYLINLCHLMLSIIEKSMKNTTEQCCFGKKLCLVLAQNAPKLRSLRFVHYVII